jgi:hypothetical protein
VRPLPIGAPVKVARAGPDWARDASGTVIANLDDGTYLVEFDEPLDDGSGDGPYAAAPFARTVLDTNLE